MPCDALSQAAEAAAGWSAQLAQEGYCIIPDAVSPHLARRIDRDLRAAFAETPFCHGGFYGSRTKRFGRLLSRSAFAEQFVRHPLILGIVREILGRWCDTIQLNLTQAIALHPGALPQLPHRDQDMWRGAVGETEYLVNVMWPLTDYRGDNGATLIWPRSHGAAALGTPPAGPPVVAEMETGSALLFLGSTLHGAGGNESADIRRGMIVSYCLGWLKPYENQWLAYPPAIARQFDAELAALVGYSQHRPNLGNFEGQCPSILLRDDIPDRIGAVDALRPDQQILVEAYVADQRRRR
ncbi:phytanoyl-CoA dioxygenase family protein [Sphingomonas koreensis]|uniref:phytanoyl-CoA dioxygenase family protein n=1 Tax=Sphingomonas koreensis TaxID=93064 RepID=UPI000835B358|nr:phytanoyl-CoA dioxygenase family protein [Sphingomonas koreensis]PJI87184.1 phytanoyl-CoA dioxygenase PhyH [Sphingomonas koreensis]RSU59599.1 phytanoyl-CoA dioxygenase family protein [Sphingomonas koreensis]RSU68753.1 phytanoyl-CoA dioxygenase family protein [Sphingomonas koreensis]